MRKVFNSQYKITQEFGVNADYYKKFGLAGHEGIDLIPSGSVWDVFALEDGIVVLDDDVVGSVASDPYGKIVTLWHPSINRATMYCHLQENFVSQGQQVKRGDKIGVMGSTGNSTGPHLHLNLFVTDSNGTRLNRGNGYLGGIDPKPFLEENIPTEAMVTLPQKELDAIRSARDQHYNDLQKERVDHQQTKELLEEEKKEHQDTVNDLRGTEIQLGHCLKITGELNDEDKKTSEQLIASQKANTTLQNEILEAKKVLGVKDTADLVMSIKTMLAAKTVKQPKPEGFIEKLLFLFS